MILQIIAAFSLPLLVFGAYMLGRSHGFHKGHHQGFLVAKGAYERKTDNTVRRKQAEIQTLERKVRHLERGIA